MRTNLLPRLFLFVYFCNIVSVEIEQLAVNLFILDQVLVF